MLGSSDSEDAGNGYDDSRIRTLVEQAEGDSVTADRLVGDEQYYPDAMEFLTESEQPQHLILLTTSSPTMQQISDYPSGSDLRSSFKKIGEGVVLVCEQSVRYIVDDYTGTFSYATIDCVEYDDDVISLLVGSITYVFNVADAADEEETQTGVRALESRFLDAHRQFEGSLLTVFRELQSFDPALVSNAQGREPERGAKLDEEQSDD